MILKSGVSSHIFGGNAVGTHVEDTAGYRSTIPQKRAGERGVRTLYSGVYAIYRWSEITGAYTVYVT